MTQLTQAQARELMEMFEIDVTLHDKEEFELLALNNPGLLDTFQTLQDIAEGK